MKKITSYVINLPSSTVRKEYMAELLSSCKSLDVRFLPAIDGRIMPEDELNDVFDIARSLRHYGRKLNNGEIGCALSHRKFYETLISSGERYALVFEDDISLMRDLDTLPFDEICAILDSDKPCVVLLSGDYWMLSRKVVTRVYDAVGAYAYLINRAAAKAMLSIRKPYLVADDWGVYKRLGIKLYAVYPYAVDANLKMDKLSSDVKQDSWSNDHRKMSKLELARKVAPSLIKRLLKKAGMFESKVRVIDNIPQF